jgi:NitT/TauT family transport system substrate-binding protein
MYRCIYVLMVIGLIVGLTACAGLPAATPVTAPQAAATTAPQEPAEATAPEAEEAAPEEPAEAEAAATEEPIEATAPESPETPAPEEETTDAEAMAEPSQSEVTIGFGSTVPIGHPGVYLPGELGFWADEGLEVTVQENDGSQQSLQLLAAGQVDFAQVSPESAVLARAQGIPVVAVYTVNRYSTRIAVPADSEIQQIADLKGQTIGIPSPTSGQVHFVRAMLREAGIDPDADVTFVPTGFGPQAAEALEAGQVAAIVYWGGFYIDLESLGYEFRYFDSPALQNAPGHVLVTTQDFIQQHPDVVGRVGRAYTKALVYYFANPEATVLAYWNAYPETKPQDMPEDEALASKITVLELTKPGFVFDVPDWDFGWNDPAGWQALIDFMVDTGQLEEGTPPSGEEMVTNEFFDAYHNFDVTEIEAMAVAQE